MTVYEQVGGTEFFTALVERFYVHVEQDPLLRPLYPEDLEPGKAHLAGFLVQYWGGPGTYSDERGHPRLRMRHAPFVIGPEHAQAWFAAMSAALRESGVDPEIEQQMLTYFADAAEFMINQY
ncbi:MAG: globin [Actinomycetia bacterium]|nr:globin [Actinomycetes bacterium]